VSKDILKTIFLKGVRDDCLDMLNMLGKGDISKESYEDIVNLCKRCSRGSTRNKSATRDTTFSRVQKSANGGATREEIGNLLEDFKTEMINSFASQIDTLQVKQKQAESDQALSIFCLKCRKKHPLRECPLNSVQVCLICELDHATDQCPSLPGVKASMKATNEEAEVVYLITQRRQWQPRGQGTNPQFSPATLNYWNNVNNQLQYGQMNAPPPNQMPPPYQDPNAWVPMPQQHNHPGQWNPYWRGPQQQLTYQNPHQQNPYQQQFQPQYQQQQLQLPPNAPQNNPPLWPQMPVQPNPNPNNKAIQNIDIHNVPALSITPMPCDEIKLRSGRIVEPIIEDAPSSESDKESGEKPSADTEDIDKPIIELAEPPFPERLEIIKTVELPSFNLLGELQNLHVKIPLLQAIRDVPIYAKTVRDLCIKNPGRKPRDPLTVHVVGELSELMLGKTPPIKYGDPGNPTVTVKIGQTFIPDVLVDLGAAINIMPIETTQLLQLRMQVRPTPTVLELADRSTIKPEGVIDDLVISVDSWEYPADFVVLQPKTHLGGHPLILGRPWLATTDAFIGCRSGSMTISDGYDTKKLTLYPHATPSVEPKNSLWMDLEDESALPVLTIGKSLSFKDETEDELINSFISDPSAVTQNMYHRLSRIFDPTAQEGVSPEMFSETVVNQVNSVVTTDTETTELFPKVSSKSIVVEIKPGKTLNINPDLSSAETGRLMKLLIEHKEAFAWDYMDMKGISSELCTHHIYIKEECRPIFQPQRRMNPNIKEIVKEELQKLLNAGFIYPISDSEWVSPLVIVPKNNGKWRVCVDYRALNKATQKDHFPLPFIDQVLDNLSGKSFSLS
jgi:hypothetical protein